MGAEQEPASSGIDEIASGDDQVPLLKNGDDRSKDTHIDVPRSGFGFNYGNRPYRDIGFAIAFVVFLTATLAVGIFATINHNPEYQWVESASYDRQKGCTVPEGFVGSNSGSNAAVESAHLDVNFRRSVMALQSGNMDRSTKAVLYVLLATLILSAPLALGLLWILRTYAKELVYATLPFIVIIPLALNITWFVACNRSEECKADFSPTMRYLAFGFVLALTVLFVWVLYSNWARIELTIRIIATASEALYQNLGLLLVLPALNLAYCLYLVPAVAFLFYAYSNGKIVLNPDLEEDARLSCGGASQVKCCVWETDSWVPAYIALTTFAILWAAVVMVELHVFTISGTIAQWYFAATESSTVGTTKRSLRHAFGPSFGTVCFAGLIVAFVRTIRSAIESSRANRGTIGFLAILIRSCLECILSAVEFVTKFTTNFAAITGESFCASAVMTFDLLKRNFLSTLVVETVAGRIFAQAIFVLSAVYGLIVWAVLCLVVEGGKHLWGVGLFAFFILLLFLVYCTGVLHNVVDTVYICYAMDVDQKEVSKPEVHDVYVLLPSSKDENAALAVPREGGP